MWTKISMKIVSQFWFMQHLPLLQLPFLFQQVQLPRPQVLFLLQARVENNCYNQNIF